MNCFVSLAVEQANERHKARQNSADSEEGSGEQAEQKGAFEPQPKFLEHSFRALRCNIVRFLEKNMPVRELSNKLADSHLFQCVELSEVWFDSTCFSCPGVWC